MGKFEHCILTPNQGFTQSKIKKAKVNSKYYRQICTYCIVINKYFIINHYFLWFNLIGG